MNRTRLHHLMTGLTLTAGLGATACAGIERPPVLVDARESLSSTRAQQLATSRPKLVADARRDLAAGERAVDDGERERAELYGHLAQLRYQTAADLDARDEIETRIKAMDRALDDQGRIADLMGRQAAALDRFREAQARFDALSAQVDAERDRARSAEAEARRRLVDARNAQAVAVGAGAPAAAPGPYNEGQALLEAGVAALDSGLTADARAAADRAIGRFEEAVAESARSKEARAVEADERARGAAQRAESERVARAAVDDAEAARAAALGGGLDQRNPAAFARATYVLELARARLDDGRFDEARARADEAKAGFGDATGDNPARRAIERAADARLAALQVADPTALSRADALLDRARDAASSGRRDRAIELADEARIAYQRAPARAVAAPTASTAPSTVVTFAPSPWGGAPMPVMLQGFPLLPPAPMGDDRLRHEAEEVVVAAQTRRAEAFARELDQLCGGRFKEFSALVDLADERLDDGALADAIAIAVRADERLDQCPAARRFNPAPPPARRAPPPAADARAAARSDARAAAREAAAVAADETARKKAEAALTEAQRLTARGRARRIDEATLDAAVRLVADAQRWASERRWVEAEALAVEARDLTRAALDGTRPGVTKAATPPPVTAADAPAPSPGATTAAPTCPAERARLREVEVEQSRAALRVDGAAEDARFKRAVTAVVSAGRFADDGRCAPASALLDDAAAVFASLREDAPAEPKAPTPAPAPIPTTASAEQGTPAEQCADLDIARRRARIAQGGAQVGLSSAGDRRRYQDAVDILDRGEQLADVGRCLDAQRAVDDARRAFEELAARPRGEQASASAPAAAASVAAAPVSAPAAVAAKVDPAQVTDARASIARAEVAAARAAHARRTAVYRTGDRLLSESRRLLDGGRAVEATRIAEQAAYAFDSVPPPTPSAGRPAAERPAAPTLPAAPADGEWRAAYGIGDQLHLDPRPVFTTGSDDPTPDSAVALDALARALVANRELAWTVRLVGYTDDRGRADRNVELSRQRAEALRRALIERGVPADRVRAEGRGAADPAYPNATPAGRALNRRVEVVLDRGQGVL